MSENRPDELARLFAKYGEDVVVEAVLGMVKVEEETGE